MCRLWYFVATSTPTLWNHIRFDSTHGGTVRPLRLSLKWSKGASLVLALYLKSPRTRVNEGREGAEVTAGRMPDACREACFAVRPHLDRISDLTYYGPLELLFPLPHASSLHNLCLLDLSPVTRRYIRRIPSICQVPPPRLRNLMFKDDQTVEAIDQAFLHIPAREIESLSVMVLHLSQHDGSLDFVAKCTRLCVLSITGGMNIRTSKPLIHFPCLQKLTVTMQGLPHLFSWTASAPSLAHLWLQGITPPPSDPLPSATSIIV